MWKRGGDPHQAAGDMAAAKDLPDQVAGIVQALRTLRFEPARVGGMALVVLYDRGLELASRLSDEGDFTATIGSRKVASVRLRLDAPPGAYFLDPGTGLRVDLLFDFPLPAATLAARATRTKVRSHLFHVASEPDLLRLKKIAQAHRSSPGDAQDIAFLEARRGASD